MPGVWGSSEAREGQVVWVLMHGGDWVLPLRNGIVPSKPPLFHWTAALLGNLGLKHSEFLIRLPSLLAASGILWLVGSFVSRIRQNLAPIVVVVLSLSYGFLRLALDARVDMFFAFFVVASILVIIEPLISGSRPSFNRVVLFYLLAGAAVLAKGPLGLVLPGFTSFVCMAGIVGFWQTVKSYVNPVGLIVFAAMALPWYLAAANVGSDAFVSRQLIFENFQRFFGGEEINTQPFWYYIPEVFMGTFPWCLVIFGILRFQNLAESERRLVKLCSLWVFSGLLLFSVASGKRASYLLPLYPPLSIIFGVYLQKAYLSLSAANFLRVQVVLRSGIFVIGVLLLGLAAVAETLIPVLVARGIIIPIFPGSLALVLLVLGVAVVLIWALTSKLEIRYSIAYLIFLLLFTGILQGGLWVKHRLKGFDVAADGINSAVGSAPLTVIKAKREEFFDPLFFYLRREVKIAPEEETSLKCSGFAVLKVDENFDKWGASQALVSTFSQVDIDGRKRREFALVSCMGQGQ
jgi:4-amino-4-deoxy-L-arabinose transferase-like glycosyltransferase